MTPKAILNEILQLPLDERLKLVEAIWDSIAATPEAVPVPDWHRAELDRRLGGAALRVGRGAPIAGNAGPRLGSDRLPSCFRAVRTPAQYCSTH